MSPRSGGTLDGESDGDDSAPPDETPTTPISRPVDPEDHEDDEDEDEDEEDEEPKLKYASLTKSQGPIYRNGDAASAFLVAGDKMVGEWILHEAPELTEGRLSAHIMVTL